MKKIALSIGLIILGFSWIGPLPRLAQEAFFIHMIIHMSVVALATPLIAWSIITSFPKICQKYTFFMQPIPVSFIELAVVWLWHAPYFHHIARESIWGLMLEQASFFIAGLWLWLSAFGGNKGSAIIGLLLTSMHMTFLGALLSLAPRSIYSHHHGYRQLTALEDQHYGGVIMLLIGGLAYLVGALSIAASLLKEKKEYEIYN